MIALIDNNAITKHSFHKVIFIVIVLLSFTLMPIIPQNEALVLGAGSTDFLTTQGKDIKYKGQTMYLRGSNAHNIEALCSRYGSAGNWGSCNIDSINLSEADYIRTKIEGGNHFRFGMAYRWYQDDKVKMFTVLDQHVAWAKKHGIWLVWNIFTLPGDCYEGFVVQSCPFWNDSTKKQQLKQFWVDMAMRYKDEPVVAGYDLLNEPLPPNGTYNTWKVYAQELTDAIRAIDPNHLIFFMSLSDPTFTSKLNGTNIVYEIHDYTPMGMTHDTTPNAYPGTTAEWCGTVLWSQKTINGLSDTLNGTNYPSTSCNDLGKRVSFDWAASNNVPMYVGEWGPQVFGNFSGGYDYIKDRGQAYIGYGVSHAFYSWKHLKDNWSIFPNKKDTDAAAMLPWYPKVL